MITELSLLCDRLGWQGGTIHDARKEALKRGWKPFKAVVVTVPPILHEKLFGAKPESQEVTAWGANMDDALAIY